MTTYNNGKTLKQAIRDAFDSLYDDEQIRIWNAYCEENQMPDDRIYDFDDDTIDTLFWGLPPSDVVSAFRFADYNDRYFTFNGDTVNSFYRAEAAIDEDELIEWLSRDYNWTLHLEIDEDEEESEEE